MRTRSKVYRVMIGSPSDLSEERSAATDAVNEWNAQHADAESRGVTTNQVGNTRNADVGSQASVGN